MNKFNTKDLRDDAKAAVDTAREGADAVAASAEQTYDQLLAQVSALKADLEALMGTARDAGSDVARDTMADARRAGRKVASAVEGGYHQAEARIEGAVTRAGDYARANPVASLGLAAGAGFVLAMLLARR